MSTMQNLPCARNQHRRGRGHAGEEGTRTLIWVIQRFIRDHRNKVSVCVEQEDGLNQMDSSSSLLERNLHFWEFSLGMIAECIDINVSSHNILGSC